MQDANRGVEHREFRDLVRCHRQDAADQHLLDVLGALRRPVDDKHGGGSRDDVEHADEGFLPHATREAAARGQQQRRGRGKDQCVGVSGRARNRMSRDHRYGRAERRHLRQRKIGEHHVAAKHLQAEPGVNAGEDDRRPASGSAANARISSSIDDAQFDAADSARASWPTL